MLAISAHVMRHQCTKAFRTIPRAALAAIRWKSTPCRPRELPICRAGTRREWAWGAREDATNHTRMQQAYLSSPTSSMFHTRQHIVESFPADGGDSQDDIAPNGAVVRLWTVCILDLALLAISHTAGTEAVRHSSASACR